MKKGLFIQSNKKQFLGAKLAKYALETRGKANEHGIPVSIMLVEEIPAYMKYAGKTYRRGSESRVHDPRDLQFFTLSRFMPPELMDYEGRAVVIDPDIFAIHDIAPLFDMDMKGAPIAACTKNNQWDTSVMLLDCEKLHHWSIEAILAALTNGSQDYSDWMELRKEKNITELPRVWNNLDTLTPDTNMLHTTNRITQPWRSGLAVDFTWNVPPKLFGVIPRFWVTHPSHYQPHPDKSIEDFFFKLSKDAHEHGVMSEAEIQDAIKSKDLRSDFLEKLKSY